MMCPVRICRDAESFYLKIMENFTFYSPTEFVFGRDTESRCGELARRYGAVKVLLVYGGGSAERSGLIGRVEASLRDSGLEWVTLKGIMPNPSDDKVYEGIANVIANGVNFILAVGGGSVIDTAKAIALGAVYDGDFWDFYSGKATAVDAMPVGVVLTIPAAGSEGSGNSVITKKEGLKKLSVRYPMFLRPRFAVMNPELTFSLPWNQTAYGIVDMLCHIYERYFSPTVETELVDAYSEAIMRDVMDQALTLRLTPDNYAARADMMWASTIAHNGLCGVGKVEDWATHALEHEVSALYDVAHGAGLACLAPAWMEFVAKRNPDKVWRFAVNVMSADPAGRTSEEVIAEGIQLLRDFYHDMGLVTSLTELIGRKPDIDALVRSLEDSKGKTLGTYVALSMDDCREIYTLAL